MRSIGKTTSALLWGASLAGLLFVAQACGGTGFSGASSKKSKDAAKEKSKTTAGSADAADGDDDEKKTTGGNGTAGSTSGSTAGGTSGSTAGSTANATGGDTSGSTANGGSGTSEGEIEGGSSQIGSGSEPGELGSDAGGEATLKSDLTIRTDYDENNECKGDGQVTIRVDSYVDGVPMPGSPVVNCPAPNQSVVVPGMCRTKAKTCIKLVFTNSEDKDSAGKPFSSDIWSDTTNFLVEGASVYFDIDGCAFGTCVEKEDDAKITLSCASTPSLELTQACQ